MKILVVNAGSSSLKYQLIDVQTEKVLAKGGCERIGIKGSLLKAKGNGIEKTYQQNMPNHKIAIELVLDALQDDEIGVIKSMDEIGAVGHRVVASGEYFKKPTLVTPEVLQTLEEKTFELAPLHNPAAATGLRACMEVMPKTPMALVFDTSFHATMPEKAYLYGIAYDDSQVYELGGYTPRFVEGSEANRKITTADDFYSLPRDLKIGIGYDVHALGRDRRLVLGGTVVDYDRGLVGHSDADVLTHAVMDALLSAAGLPDIGVLFPDTDPSFKNADSIMLLKRVRAAVSEKGFSVSCVSAVIAAQKPKLMSYIPEMRKNIADALQIAADAVNVSATTTEGLGIVGEERGMAASASCLLKKEETERGKNN